MEKQRCKDSKKEGQERAKGVRYATRITGAAQRYLSGSPGFHHRNWGRTINQTCCSDHIIKLKPASLVRRIGVGAGRVLFLTSKGTAGWHKNPGCAFYTCQHRQLLTS